MAKTDKRIIVVGSIVVLLLISGLILFWIKNETIHIIATILLLIGSVVGLMFVAYLIGSDDTEDYYKERLTDIREGHRVLEEYHEKKIDKQNEEIKKLKAQIKKMRTNRKL